MHAIDLNLRCYVKCTCALDRPLGKRARKIRKAMLDDYKKNNSCAKNDINRLQLECFDKFMKLLLDVPGVDEQFINNLKNNVNNKYKLKEYFLFLRFYFITNIFCDLHLFALCQGRNQHYC